ncbi:4477_t:CDS:2, partial [Rhizophagus irregularis]
MPPPKHSYTKYITVLNEKANKFNYFALCCYCKAKITNTKRLVISHLKSCNKFEEQYSENERNRILFPERYEEIQEKDQTEGESSFSHEQNFSFPSSSLSHHSSFSSSSLSHRSSFSASSLSQHSHEESANKKRKTKITYYMPRPTPLSKQEYTQWEDLVLNSTIDNGNRVQWEEIKEFTLNFLSDLDKQNIKYNAVITDSASSNQAA